MASMILAIVLLASTLPAAAGASTIENNLDAQQEYIRKLVNVMQAPEYKMASTVVRDNYFKIQEINGIFDLFSSSWAAIWGEESYKQDKLRTVMLQAVALDPVADGFAEALTFATEPVQYLDSVRLDLKVLGIPEPTSKAYQFLEDLSPFLTIFDIEMDVNEIISHAVNSYGRYLYALEFVSNHTTDDTMAKAAKSVIDTCTSTTTIEALKDTLEVVVSRSAEAIYGEGLSYLSLGIIDAISSFLDIAAGDVTEATITELYATQLQNEVYTAFSDLIYKDGGNYLLRSYTNEELSSATILVEFYLKLGVLGMEANYPDQAAQCVEALNTLRGLSIPKDPSIRLDGYSIPGKFVPLSKGDKFAVVGTIMSESELESVTVRVTGESGIVFEETQHHINSNRFDLVRLDDRLEFNHLPVGTYVYSVLASTEDDTRLLAAHPFCIIEENDGIVINGYRLPRVINEGAFFNVTGTISSKTPIQAVSVEVLTEDGQRLTGGKKGGLHTYHFDLSQLDPMVEFNILKSYNSNTGTVYRYHISVETQNGKTVLVDQPFVLKK